MLVSFAPIYIIWNIYSVSTWLVSIKILFFFFLIKVKNNEDYMKSVSVEEEQCIAKEWDVLTCIMKTTIESRLPVVLEVGISSTGDQHPHILGFVGTTNCTLPVQKTTTKKIYIFFFEKLFVHIFSLILSCVRLNAREKELIFCLFRDN